MAKDATLLCEDEPDHMIIWLSQDIGQPDCHQHLKAVFSSTADPRSGALVNLTDKDIDEIICREGPMSVGFEGVRFLLAIFTSVEDCIKYFEQNPHKRIFFITSGSIGRIAVPIILNRFRHVFTDPLTHESYASIYVFCHNIEWNMEWALAYYGYIQMFDFDADLLVRIVRDIAAYYVIQGKRLLGENRPNNAAAYHRLSWAHELYQRYNRMESVSLKEEMDEVVRLCADIEEKLKSLSDEDDNLTNIT